MDYKKPKFKEKYENFIGGKFVPPLGMNILKIIHLSTIPWLQNIQDLKKKI